MQHIAIISRALDARSRLNAVGMVQQTLETPKMTVGVWGGKRCGAGPWASHCICAAREGVLPPSPTTSHHGTPPRSLCLRPFHCHCSRRRVSGKPINQSLKAYGILYVSVPFSVHPDPNLSQVSGACRLVGWQVAAVVTRTNLMTLGCLNCPEYINLQAPNLHFNLANPYCLTYGNLLT